MNNYHDLIDGNSLCHADAKSDANGSSSKDELQPNEQRQSLNEHGLLLSSVVSLLEEQRQSNRLLLEICQQNAMLIGMMATDGDEEDDDTGKGQYLDGSST